tara:strand:+ start:28 stop:204 length:177 start_codon:yes stop_codon:yes gene_type:complete
MIKNIKNTSKYHKYGSPFPLKNAGRPEGSRTKKRPLLINDFLRDEIIEEDLEAPCRCI